MSTGDIHIDLVRLLLPCSGSAGATEIIDRAPVPGTVTCSGAAALTMSNSRDGRAALSFNGTSSVAVVSPVGQNLSFAEGDFTIECWLRASAVDTQRTVLDFRPSRDSVAPWLWLNGNGGLVLQDHYQNSARITTANGTIVVGAWHHVAISRAAGVTRLFVNGTVRGTYDTYALYYGYQSAVYIGRNVYSGTPQAFSGLLQDIRVTIGLGRYVDNFTPPVSLPLTAPPPPAWLALPSPLARRTGFGAAEWLDSAGAPWIDAAGVGYPFVPGLLAPALRAAPIGHSEHSEIASGPFGADSPLLDFAYRVISEVGADVLTITVRRADTGAIAVMLATVSGLGAWTRGVFDPATLPAGPEGARHRYRLHARYEKDGAISVGADTAYLAPVSGFPLPGAWAVLPSPLSAPVFVTASPSSTIAAKFSLSGPLGAPAFVATPHVRGFLALASPLGAPGFVAAVPVSAWAALASPLGAPALLAALVPMTWAALASPLGTPAMRARQIYAIAPPVVPADLLVGGAGARLLTDPLPLRRTVDLPTYNDDVYLPWVFGRATVRAVPLDAERVEWLVADHPIVGVEWVSVGGVEIDGWQLVQRVDDVGHPVALIRLTQPAKANDAVAVRVVGRRHPVTGGVLTHPARIAAELLAACGWAPPTDAFARLIDDLPGLEVGVVYNGGISLREALAGLLEPLGAWWSAGTLATPQARVDVPGEPVFTLNVGNCEDISAQVDHSQIATIGRVTFDYDWAAGVARQALTVEALGAIDRYGKIEADFPLPHVRTARDALACATTRLARRARAAWRVEATIADRGDLPAPGDTVRIDHPHVPAGLAVVRSRRRGRANLSATLSMELLAGAEPAVVLARRGRLIDDTASDAMAVTFKDGWATFTITDDDGNALAGASVTLDGAMTRNTDVRGQVQFKTTRGTHTLTVAAEGYMTFEMEIAV